ncbi:MAG: glycoside hydrolase family 127 protein, partial [Clostridia bacterium]|nr:glycoside hydrolase family 127 protein [Clostridia bacterium]
GDAFFYENPLSIHLRNRVKDVSVEKGDRFPITQRKVVFGCSCCPPNVNRVLASLERYVARIDGDTVFVDQYTDSAIAGDGFSVEVKTDYPVSGEIRVTCRGVGKLGLRIPGWCRKFTLSVPYRMEKGYAVIESPGEAALSLDMTPVLYEANPEIFDCAGRGAVMRGPVVYAYEAVDNGGYVPERYRVARELNPNVGDTAFCGIPTLTVDGAFVPDRAELYTPAGESDLQPARIQLIPYFAFANRGPSDMSVWMLL